MQASSLFTVLVLSLALWTAVPAAHAGGPPVDFTASSWSGTALLTAKIPGAGTLKGPASIDLDFGPQGEPALAANEFLILLDDGMALLPLSGTWSVDEKGGVVLALDTSTLAQDLLDLLYDVCVQEIGSDCDILLLFGATLDPEQLQLAVKAKSKDGVEMLSAKGKLPFVLILDEEPVLNVTISFKTVDVFRD